MRFYSQVQNLRALTKA